MVNDDVEAKFTLAMYIDEMMEERQLKDKEIASALGYDSGTIIRLVREGKLRLPLEQIPVLADAIGATREWLMDAALREYFPDAVRALIMTYGHGLTENELAIVQMVRDVSGNSDPEPADRGLWAKIVAAVGRSGMQP